MTKTSDDDKADTSPEDEDEVEVGPEGGTR